MSGEGHSNNRTARAKQGLVSHDNTGGYFIVECQECGVVYPSFQCDGGDAIADTGDYNDAICAHCGQESPEECSNVGLVWNTQQLKINELQQRLTAADEQIDLLSPRHTEQPEGKRERFEKWVMATKHPVYGFLDGRSLARGDDRTGYADEYMQGLWVAYLAFGAEQLAPVAVDETNEFSRWTHEVIAESRIGGVTIKIQRMQHLTPSEEKAAHDAWMARAALSTKSRQEYIRTLSQNL